MQLGHPVSKKCPNPSRPYQLTIFDLSGVHQVIVQYCVCTPEDPAYRRRQLLRKRWFPATLVRPHTVFTFKLLNFFHELQSHNKTNLYDFYNTIVHLSNSAGLSPEVVSALQYLVSTPPFPSLTRTSVPLQRGVPCIPDVGSLAHREVWWWGSSPRWH